MKAMPAKLILLLILTMPLAGNFAAAQDSGKVKLLLDSAAAAARKDSTKARMLLTVCWLYHNTNTDSAMYYAQQALVYAEKTGDKKDIATAKYYTGRLYYIKSNDSAAMQNFDDTPALDYEELLSEQKFLRVHRAHLINPKCIQSYTRDHELKMTDGSIVQVSRRKWDTIKDKIHLIA